MPKIPIAVVGLGFGKHIVNQLLDSSIQTDFTLAAVCDANAVLAYETAERLGITCYSSLDSLLDDDSIPTIGLFTGPVGRATLIQRIVDRGRDVMTTKPLELDPAAALAALRHAEDIGRIVHLNSPSAAMPQEMRQIEAWRDEFDLGRPVGCRRDVWATYNEVPDGSWYDDPELCPVAPIYRLGIYAINDLLRLFGPASRVVVLQSRLRTGRPTADNGQLGIEFKNGAIANIFASFCVHDGDHYRGGMVLNYERGTIYGNAGPVRSENTDVELSLVMERTGHREVVATCSFSSHSGAYDWATFARAIRGDRVDVDLTPEQAVEGIKVIKAMKSALSGNGMAEVQD